MQFDGNPAELHTFIKSVDDILSALPPIKDTKYKVVLFNTIRKKITGIANDVLCSNGEVKDWKNAREILINNFVDRRSESSLFRDLHELKQNKNTSEQFYRKITSINALLMNFVNVHESRAEVRELKRNFYNEACLAAFLANLNEPLGAIVRASDPETLPDALKRCIQEENIMYLRQKNNKQFGEDHNGFRNRNSFGGFDKNPNRNFNPNFHSNYNSNANFNFNGNRNYNNNNSNRYYNNNNNNFNRNYNSNNNNFNRNYNNYNGNNNRTGNFNNYESGQNNTYPTRQGGNPVNFQQRFPQNQNIERGQNVRSKNGNTLFHFPSCKDLPYIIDKELGLRIIVDTGASNSYMSENCYKKYFSNETRENKTFCVETPHGYSVHSGIVRLKDLAIIGAQSGESSFGIYEVSQMFDMLFGSHELRKMIKYIDYETNTIVTKDGRKIPVFYVTDEEIDRFLKEISSGKVKAVGNNTNNENGVIYKTNGTNYKIYGTDYNVGKSCEDSNKRKNKSKNNNKKGSINKSGEKNKNTSGQLNMINYTLEQRGNILEMNDTKRNEKNEFFGDDIGNNRANYDENMGNTNEMKCFYNMNNANDFCNETSIERNKEKIFGENNNYTEVDNIEKKDNHEIYDDRTEIKENVDKSGYRNVDVVIARKENDLLKELTENERNAALNIDKRVENVNENNKMVNRGKIEDCNWDNELMRDWDNLRTEDQEDLDTDSNIGQNIDSNKNETEKIIRTGHLSNGEGKLLIKLCTEFKDIFAREGEPLTFTNEVKHSIRTIDEIPVFTKSYRYPEIHKEEVRKQIKEMLEQDIIQPSASPWSSPIWIVPKKKDASNKTKYRIVIDYRKLNAKTIPDRYPIPNINEILDKLGRCMYFSTLDLKSGFYQIEMDPKDIDKTAFTVDNGRYSFKRMPQGLSNSPATFQRVVDNILRDLINKGCLVYMDDIIVYSTSLEEHILLLKKVFSKLRESNLKIQLDKSHFLKQEVEFLGHVVTPEGVKPNPDKIKAIKKFPIPRTVRQIKSFLGLIGYYRKFIQGLANITKPMTACLKKKAKIDLSNEYIKSFETCKLLLCNDPILQYPDFTKPFIVTTDASNFALGAVLSQGRIGSDLPIAYASRTLNEHEINYSTIEKECLAIVYATKYFRPYLYGRKFQIVTDHQPLTWLMSLKEPNSRLVRWRLRLEEYDYEIVYKKGKVNTNADALSRIQILNLTNGSIQDENITNTTRKITKPVQVDVNDSSIDSMGSEESHRNGQKGSNGKQTGKQKHIITQNKPINMYNIQIVFIKNKHNTEPLKNIKNIGNKKRIIIQQREYSKEDIMKHIKTSIELGKCNCIYCEDEKTFKLIEEIAKDYFPNYNIVRSTKILEDAGNQDDEDRIIMDYHINNNHRGIPETIEHLSRVWYMKNIKTKIAKVVNNCHICKQNKYDRRPIRQQMHLTETPQKPLDIIHIDIFHIDNMLILTILDKFSRFASGYVLESRNSISVVECLIKYMSERGIPKMIVTDNAKEFTATLFEELLNKYGTKHHVTTQRNSTGNSPVERLHSTLIEIYRIIKRSSTEKNKNTTLYESILTYNNSIHSVTKLTPIELMQGHIGQKNTLDTVGNNIIPFTDYLENHKNNFNNIRRIVQQRNLKYKEGIIKNHNRRVREPINYDIGQEIYYRDNRRQKDAQLYQRDIVTENLRHVVRGTNKKIHKTKIRRGNNTNY
jgi:hypothetical protein